MLLLGVTEGVFFFVVSQVVLLLALGGQTANRVFVEERVAAHRFYSRVYHMITSH